jgi:G3E family GTPase
MIPVALITGFLGSGKTTLLRHLVERYRERRIVYLVNEFSAVDIDGELVRADEDDVIPLPGGSIFCTCLVTEFIQALTSIPGRFDGVEGVVIEASGVANPKIIEKMLRETRLDELYALASVVSVVDPGSFGTLLQTLPNIAAQVEASDTVLVNKTDLFDEETVARTEAAVLAIQPRAELHRTVQCAADIDLFPATRRERGLDGEYASCADPNYSRFILRRDTPVDLDWLLAEIASVRDDLYRAKGYVLTTEGMRFLDVSPAAVTSRASSEPKVQTEVVMIARGSARDKVKAFVERVRSAP